MADRRLIMPLPKSSFKDDSTYQDSDGFITFRNSGGNQIWAMLSGEYKLAPWKGARVATADVNSLATGTTIVKGQKESADLDVLSISGSINGRKVSIVYVDGFDADPKQPITGTVKQGENLFIGDPSEYLKIKIAIDGKDVSPQEASALVGGIAYKEDEETALAKGEQPDNIMTPGKDESKESSGAMGLIVKLGIAYAVYKYVLKG